MKETSIKCLILLVKGKPLLYDTKHRDYKNVELKNQTWIRIAVELGCNVGDVKRKWKYLRERYRRLKNDTNSANDLKKLKQWPLYKALSFLEKYCLRVSIDPPTIKYNTKSIKMEPVSPPSSPVRNKFLQETFPPKALVRKPFETNQCVPSHKIETMEFMSLETLPNPIEPEVSIFSVKNPKRSHVKTPEPESDKLTNLLKKMDALISSSSSQINELEKGKHHHFSNYLEMEMNELTDNEANEFKNFCLIKLYEIQNKRKK